MFNWFKKEKPREIKVSIVIEDNEPWEDNDALMLGSFLASNSGRKFMGKLSYSLYMAGFHENSSEDLRNGMAMIIDDIRLMGMIRPQIDEEPDVESAKDLVLQRWY